MGPNTEEKRSDLEQRARRQWSALFEERDFGKAREWWSDQSVNHFLALGITVRGADALETFFRELFAAVPDMRMAIDHVVADGSSNHVVVQWRAHGTTSGEPFQGLAPSPGRSVDLRGCDVFHLDPRGRVLENTVYYDGAQFARSIGMLPPRGSALERATVLAFNAASRVLARLKR